jgi:hypothetical protein
MTCKLTQAPIPTAYLNYSSEAVAYVARAGSRPPRLKADTYCSVFRRSGCRSAEGSSAIPRTLNDTVLVGKGVALSSDRWLRIN